jgi:outer membrane autotransporter protein
LTFHPFFGSPLARIGRIAAVAAVATLGVPADSARADCVTSGSITTCGTTSPNPFPGTVGAGFGDDNRTVTVGPGAGISAGDAPAISLGDGAAITVNGTVENAAVASGGGYGTGGNTIEFNNNGTLTIGPGGSVLSNGTQGSAEAVNVQGTNNTIINNGRINAVNAAAIWSQSAGFLTIVNNGVISTGPLDNPNLTATVIGGSLGAGIDFTNRGTVYGSLAFGSGSDFLRLYTGSRITGDIDGGPGIDSIFLLGSGTDTYTGSMTGFEFLTKQGPGTWILSGVNTGLTQTTIEDGTLAVAGTLVSPVAIEAGGTLAGTGTVAGDVVNRGTVAPGLPAEIGTLTVTGAYSADGGRLVTRVGGSPEAPRADILQFSGGAALVSGTTPVFVRNAGGLGAPTTGDGIPIVLAIGGATTAADSFRLGERALGGAYEYNLYRGGTGAGTAGNWYLRSIDPDHPSQPLYRLETALYPALPPMLSLYMNSLVDTLDQRRANLSPNAGQPSAAGGAWGRAVGTRAGASSAGRTNWDSDFGFLQLGQDLYGEEGPEHRTYAGAFVAAGHGVGSADTAARGRAGSLRASAFSIGVYATRFWADGFYADALAQATKFEGLDANSAAGGTLSTDAWGGSLSLEGGKRFDLNGNVWVVPQVQIVGDTISISDKTDAYAQVSWGDQNSLRGRLGLLAGTRFGGPQDKPYEAWARVSLWNVFGGSTRTTVAALDGANGVGFTAAGSRNGVSLDAGLRMAMSATASLFANASYDRGFDGAQWGGTGRIGFEASW